MYSCAIFETEFNEQNNNDNDNKTIRYTDSLESAQTRKIDALLSRLEPLGPEHILLDIGIVNNLFFKI
jgi:cyclopropane fatty-acyl-phospholipid synthase-like methyltransferase